MAILVFIITILLLVVIHELGHFLVAKKFNIKVLEFGFGIPPRIWGKKIGETLVSINWLPFGGFVKLLGEDEEDPDVLENERSFASQGVWKRIAVVAAGVVMNLFLAWILFWGVLVAQGFKTQLPLIVSHNFFGVNQTNETVVLISNVVKDSPADKAGIKNGDRILKFNGTTLKDADQLVALTKQHAGSSINLTLSDPDASNQKQIEVTPRVNPPKNQGALGVQLGSFDVANLNYATPIQRLFSGPVHSFNLGIYSFEVLGKTIALSFKTHNLAPVSNSVSGPVGVTSIVSEILQTRQAVLLYFDFLAALSLNLAIFNVLPIPGLDGGRLFFLLFEALFKKKAHPVVEKYIHTIGLVVLIGLIILVTVSDIKKLIF